MLMMVEGTKNGESFFGLPAAFITFSWFCSIKPKPPIPDPIATPIRGAFCSVTFSPESLNA